MAIDLSKVKVEKTENTIVLVKGGNTPLEATIVRVGAGLSWDEIKGTGKFDADAVAYCLNADGKLVKDGMVYYGNTVSADGAVTASDDNQTGAGDGDDETITAELNKLSSDVVKIVFAVNIHEAKERGQNFGQVPACAIRLFDIDSGAVLVEYDLAEDFSTETAVLAGELYLNKGVWKFKALGQGKTGNLVEVSAEFK